MLEDAAARSDDDSSTPKTWFRKVNSWLPRRKKDELKECQRKNGGNILYTTVLYAFYLETSWWIETNIIEVVNHGRIIWPELDSVSLSSSLAWKLYWIEVKQRVLPPLVKYQATMLLLQLLQHALTSLVSGDTLLKMNQHPPRRARSIAERESDRILVGTEVFVASLWANLLFYGTNWMVSQIACLYDFYFRQRLLARRRGSVYCDKEDIVYLANDSWAILVSNGRRYLYSSLGAGLGSIILPGWGTLVGTGMGDEWSKKQVDPPLPSPVASLIRTGVSNVSLLGSTTAGLGWWFRPVPPSNGKGVDDSCFEKSHHDDLICGCCQTTEFSSNPNSRDSAPISSSVCSHTICKSCVQRCHLAYLERQGTYEEWIKCPLCNAPRAFSSHDHLVNRSLCAAIAAIEKSQSSTGPKSVS